jgi:hypothetical protein
MSTGALLGDEIFWIRVGWINLEVVDENGIRKELEVAGLVIGDLP